MKRILQFRCLALSLSIVLLAGCAADSSDSAAAIGGFGGAATGAGAGALIANATGNDVGNSTLVGAAIGVPVGIVAGVAVHELGQSDDRDELDAAVETNAAAIAQNQGVIESIRGDIERDSYNIQLNEDLADRTYDGPTVGDPRR